MIRYREPGLAPYADLQLWRRRAVASIALNALLFALLLLSLMPISGQRQ